MAPADPSWTDIASFAILALAAIVAAWQVWEARRLREDQARPFVIVDFETEESLFFLVVSNIGHTMARDVRIRIEPELTSSIYSSNERLRDLKMLSEGIATLAPGKTIRTVFDNSVTRDRSTYPDVYKAELEYRGTRGKPFREPIDLDLGVFWNLQRIHRRDVHDLYKQVEKIAKTLDSWSARGGQGLLRLSPKEARERFEERRAALERHNLHRAQTGDQGATGVQTDSF